MTAAAHPLATWRDRSGLIDAFPCGGVVCDTNGTIVHCNRMALQRFGFHADELRGESIDRLFAPGLLAAHPALVKNPTQHPDSQLPQQVSCEWPARESKGAPLPLALTLTTLDEGEQRHILITLADPPANPHLESNFSRIVDAAPVGMLIVDAEGKILHANQRLLQIFGYPPKELEGQTLEILIPERHRQHHPAYRNGYQREPTTRNMGRGRDLTGLHRSGIEIPIEIGLNPITTRNGSATIATVIDITERKKSELKLKQLNADLDEFTYVASHDLRSPLRGISSLLEWIAEDLGEATPDSVRNNLERAHLRIARMEKLVDDLLAYARSGHVGADVTAIEPQALIEEVVQLVAPPEGFEVSLHVEPGTVRTARTPLETVLRNLISNAIKHHDRSSGTITITMVHEDNLCRFEVADDGPGIPDSAHERVFKLFQTLSSDSGSRSGVGLAVSKRLIEAHGGRIEIHSPVGERGTCFRFWWPRFARRDIHD